MKLHGEALVPHRVRMFTAARLSDRLCRSQACVVEEHNEVVQAGTVDEHNEVVHAGTVDEHNEVVHAGTVDEHN